MGRKRSSIVIVSFILFFSIFVFQQYIIEGRLFLPRGILSDILRVNLPTYYHMYDNLIQKTNFWSWSMGIGTSMFTHADVYGDPFTYILFLGGRDNIPVLLIWSFIAKLIFEALSFSYYLEYFQLHRFAIIFSSVLYAFSGYSLIMGGNLALGTILVYAPLVFRGIEVYLESNQKKLLTLSLFLVCVYSYYYFYIIGILSIIYILFKSYRKKELFRKIVGLAIMGCVAGLLAAFILFPQIQLALNSTRLNSGIDINLGSKLFIPEVKTLATAFIRMFGNNLLGDAIYSPYVGYAYGANHDYFQTDWYVTALMFPLYFQYIYYKTSNRKKVFCCSACIIIATGIPFFSYLMNGFSTINYRWMFVITLFSALLIALAIDTIISEQRINVSVYFFSLLCAGIGFACSVFILGITGDVSIRNIFLNLLQNGKIYVITLAFIYILFSLLIYFYNTNTLGQTKQSIPIILTILIIMIDTYGNYHSWFGSENATSNYNIDQYCGYEDTSMDIIKEIQSSDTGFYRIHKDFDSVIDLNGIPSNNDAMAQQYYGLKSYCSINNQYYISFLQELGIYVALPLSVENYKANGIAPSEITGPDLNYINGVENNYDLYNYLGVKYLLSLSKEENIIMPLIYKDITEEVNVYENTAAYPLAFVNYGIIPYSVFHTLNDEDKTGALLYNTIVEDHISYDKQTPITDENIIEYAQKKQKDYKLLNFQNDMVEFKIQAEKNAQFLSFSIPYDRDWHIYIDDVEVETCKVNISLLGCQISEGEHVIELKYRPKAFYFGIAISIISGVILITYWGFAKKNEKRNRENRDDEYI